MGGVLGTAYPGFRPGDPGLDIPDAPPDAPARHFPGVRQHLYRIGKVKGRETCVLLRPIQVPLSPFMGVDGCRPRRRACSWTRLPDRAATAARRPGSGLQDPLAATWISRTSRPAPRSSCPVFQYGAQFYTGDSHSAQGDGEVSGTAIEHSLSGIFRFIVHKGKTMLAAGRERKRTTS